MSVDDIRAITTLESQEAFAHIEMLVDELLGETSARDQVKRAMLHEIFEHATTLARAIDDRAEILKDAETTVRYYRGLAEALHRQRDQAVDELAALMRLLEEDGEDAGYLLDVAIDEYGEDTA